MRRKLSISGLWSALPVSLSGYFDGFKTVSNAALKAMEKRKTYGEKEHLKRSKLTYFSPQKRTVVKQWDPSRYVGERLQTSADSSPGVERTDQMARASCQGVRTSPLPQLRAVFPADGRAQRLLPQQHRT